MDNNQQQAQSTQVLTWEQQNQYLVQRGISESVWSVLCNTLYPSNKPESVILAWDYCEARELDIMMKPIHLVPMSVKNSQTGKFEMRDVPMPGVGLYRIQASRSGDYAGAEEPEFGPAITKQFKDKYKGDISITFPEWCKYTVHKLIGDRIVSFSAKEYWLENYATAGRDTDCPNSMWQKRVYAQLAKCTEAQALRKGWPEIGQEPTAEEMEGKEYFGGERDITPSSSSPAINDGSFRTEVITKGIKAIESGKKTPEQVIAFAESKGIQFSTEELQTLHSIKVAA